jgi:hypothetical protein
VSDERAAFQEAEGDAADRIRVAQTPRSTCNDAASAAGYSAGRHTAVAMAWGVLPVGLYQEQPQVE